MSCGDGKRERTVECSGGRGKCHPRTKPQATTSCNLGSCPEWKVKDWSQVKLIRYMKCRKRLTVAMTIRFSSNMNKYFALQSFRKGRTNLVSLLARSETIEIRWKLFVDGRNWRDFIEHRGFTCAGGKDAGLSGPPRSLLFTYINWDFILANDNVNLCYRSTVFSVLWKWHKRTHSGM